MWPMVLDNSRDECKRSLRRYELDAYSSVVTALRAQGDLNKDKRKLLQDLCQILSISLERHRAEVRRAVNDERLNTIAHHMTGANTSTEWTIEGRRLIPLLPRLVPQTAFTGVANTAANVQLTRNQSMLSPTETAIKQTAQMDANHTLDDTYDGSPKRRRIDSQSQPTYVPIKSEPLVLQNAANHRIGHSVAKTGATSRAVVNASNCYTVSTTMSQAVGHSGTRVIFVSTPTSSPSSVTTSSKNVTAIPLISRHTLGSPQKTTIDIPNTRMVKQKPGRPTTGNTSIVGLIGVSGNQKMAKNATNKTTINASNVSLAGNATRIPLIPGTQVFTKSNGQQQVVVFPLNSRQIPMGQAVKAISIPSSSPSVNTNTPTFIYQSAANMKNLQKVQAPNLIIMQQKNVTQMAKPITTIPMNAITLSKANIAKTQIKPVLGTHKKTVVDIGPTPGVQSHTFTLSDNSKIITKRVQTSPKALQEMSESIPDLNQRIIEIDASNESIAGIFNNFKGTQGTITQAEFMEILKKANISNTGQSSSDHQRDEMHDSSGSEDTVSTSESPPHDMTDFADTHDNVKNVFDN